MSDQTTPAPEPEDEQDTTEEQDEAIAAKVKESFTEEEYAALNGFTGALDNMGTVAASIVMGSPLADRVDEGEQVEDALILIVKNIIHQAVTGHSLSEDGEKITLTGAAAPLGLFVVRHEDVELHDDQQLEGEGVEKGVLYSVSIPIGGLVVPEHLMERLDEAVGVAYKEVTGEDYDPEYVDPIHVGQDGQVMATHE